MAKYFKKKDVDNTVRSVMDDGKSVCYGCLGTVADLKSVGILECCDAPDDSWCFIASDRINGRNGRLDYFGDSKLAVKQHIENAFERL